VPAGKSRADATAELGLAKFAQLRYADIPESARGAFDRLALDFLSVVIAGLGDAECVRAADAFGGLSRFGANASATAFALGVCAHWFDWDDTDDESHVHGGAVIFPALLGVCAARPPAKRRDARGEFVAAAVAGYEIACRVGGHLKDHGHRGWMPTGSGGTLGAAAAAARLAGCADAEILSAMGIAGASAGISRQALADRANSKGVLAGIAARTAADALALAQRGVAGAPRFLTGAYGLCALEGEGAPMEAPKDLGSELRIERMSVKPYPCCRSAHAVIDGILEFRRESPGAAASVDAIDVSAPPGVYERCGAAFRLSDNPRLSAQFSIPYTAAVALRKGSVELEDFEAPRIAGHSAQWKALIEAVRVRRDPGCTADALAPVHLRLASDAKVVAERDVTTLKGDPGQPLTPVEQHEKLCSAGKGMLDAAQIVEAEALVRGLQHDGPHGLVRWLRAQAAARVRAVAA
jgi:2-methylcitrate dehydratase PrpD